MVIYLLSDRDYYLNIETKQNPNDPKTFIDVLLSFNNNPQIAETIKNILMTIPNDNYLKDWGLNQLDIYIFRFYKSKIADYVKTAEGNNIYTIGKNLRCIPFAQQMYGTEFEQFAALQYFQKIRLLENQTLLSMWGASYQYSNSKISTNNALLYISDNGLGYYNASDNEKLFRFIGDNFSNFSLLGNNASLTTEQITSFITDKIEKYNPSKQNCILVVINTFRNNDIAQLLDTLPKNIPTGKVVYLVNTSEKNRVAWHQNFDPSRGILITIDNYKQIKYYSELFKKIGKNQEKILEFILQFSTEYSAIKPHLSGYLTNDDRKYFGTRVIDITKPKEPEHIYENIKLEKPKANLGILSLLELTLMKSKRNYQIDKNFLRTSTVLKIVKIYNMNIQDLSYIYYKLTDQENLFQGDEIGFIECIKSFYDLILKELTDNNLSNMKEFAKLYSSSNMIINKKAPNLYESLLNIKSAIAKGVSLYLTPDNISNHFIYLVDMLNYLKHYPNEIINENLIILDKMIKNIDNISIINLENLKILEKFYIKILNISTNLIQDQEKQNQLNILKTKLNERIVNLIKVQGNVITVGGKYVGELNKKEIITIHNLYDSIKSKGFSSQRLELLLQSIKQWTQMKESVETVKPTEFLSKIPRNIVDSYIHSLTQALNQIDPSNNIIDRYINDNSSEKVIITFEKISAAEEKYNIYVHDGDEIHSFTIDNQYKDIIDYIKEYNKIMREKFPSVFKE